MSVTIAIPAAFLIASWIWAGYYREVNADNLALWAIASAMILPIVIR